jgi:hypothetical protein
LLAILLTGCATKTLVGTDKGGLIEQRNFKKSSLPTKYDVSLDMVEHDGSRLLQITVLRNDPVKEEWDAIRSVYNVYETRDGDQVVKTLEKSDATIVEAESRVVDVTSQINSPQLKLTVGKSTSSAKLLNSEANFEFKSLNLKPDNLPSDAKVTVEFDKRVVDVSPEFAKLVAAENDRRIASQREAEVERRKPENRFKMKFCAHPDFNNTIFLSGTIQRDCIYGIGVYPVEVLQVVEGGVLIKQAGNSPYGMGKVVFIKTKRAFADGDLIRNVYLKSIGTIKYESVMGAWKTVNAFEYLGDFEG